MKARFTILTFLLVCVFAFFAGPADAVNKEIPSIPALLEGSSFGMDSGTVLDKVTSRHNDAEAFSDGVFFVDSMFGKEWNICYGWTNEHLFSEIICKPKEQGSMSFDQVKTKLIELYGDPDASWSDGNIFEPASEYMWPVPLNSSSYEQVSENVKYIASDAIEYFFEYEKKTILVAVVALHHHEEPGNDLVELFYLVLTDEDAKDCNAKRAEAAAKIEKTTVPVVTLRPEETAAPKNRTVNVTKDNFWEYFKVSCDYSSSDLGDKYSVKYILTLKPRENITPDGVTVCFAVNDETSFREIYISGRREVQTEAKRSIWTSGNKEGFIWEKLYLETDAALFAMTASPDILYVSGTVTVSSEEANK